MNVTIEISTINVFIDRYPANLENILKDILMPTVQEIKDAIFAEAQEVATKIAELEASIQALKDQIANGSPATEQDLQDILEGVKGIFNTAPPSDEQPVDPGSTIEP